MRGEAARLENSTCDGLGKLTVNSPVRAMLLQVECVGAHTNPK